MTNEEIQMTNVLRGGCLDGGLLEKHEDAEGSGGTTLLVTEMGLGVDQGDWQEDATQRKSPGAEETIRGGAGEEVVRVYVDEMVWGKKGTQVRPGVAFTTVVIIGEWLRRMGDADEGKSAGMEDAD